MTTEAYRALLLNPASTSDAVEPFERESDAVLVIQDGTLALVLPAREIVEHLQAQRLRYAQLGLMLVDGQLQFAGSELRHEQHAILPGCANLHHHSFQPEGVEGKLLEVDHQSGKKTGWLVTTLQQGEAVAKSDPLRAREMIRKSLADFARNGVSRSLHYTTSSVECAEIVLEEADEIGLDVVVGYVAMDQHIDDITPGLQTTGEEALRATQYLLGKYSAKRIAVIDRFPICVSSPTRKALADLARAFDALYETHLDETQDEQAYHKSLYGGRSIVQVLIDDGVFEPDSRVGLAHAIHTSPEDIDRVGRKIAAGCTVYIRACADSNAQLGSHFAVEAYGSFRYVPFPLQAWEKAGAIITTGSDHGAGRAPRNVFNHLLMERGRLPMEMRPSAVQLLQYGTLNGIRSLGIYPRSVAIREGNAADFVAVEMAGAGSFYGPDSIHAATDTIAARIIQGGADSHYIRAHYVRGRKLK